MKTMADVLTFAIPFTLIIALVIQFLNRVKHKKHLPPSPRKLPLLGNLHQLLGNDLPHVSLQKLSNKIGPIMLLQLGSVPTLVISSANVAKEVIKVHDVIFSNRPSLYAAKKLSYEGNNISFAPYGEYWREVRKIAILELLSVRRVQSFSVERNEEVALMVESIAQCYPGPVNLSKATLSLANRLVSRVAFGKSCDVVIMSNNKHRGSFYEILREVQNLLGENNIADSYPWLGKILNKFNGVDARLDKNFDELDRFYDEVIQEHRDESRIRPDHEDIVDVLLRLQKDPSQTLALNDNQVKGVITDMFIAGSDTSSATLVWAMAELIRNPSIMKKAQDEVRQVVKRGTQRVYETDLPQLTYLTLVIKETLRLHPPVPLLVPRETTEDCMIKGYAIPAKARVLINAKAISTDPNVWGTDANEFKPERFLGKTIDYKGLDFEFIPFGVGRRGCPGISFAIMLVELALANLLLSFDWSLPDGVTSDDIDMVEVAGITTHKKTPLVLLATPRSM